MHENITLALNSARAIGCNVVNIGASDILDGTKHLLLGLLWQIIKIGLLKQINVVAHAELATLLEGDETISEFARLSPEDILIRWVNYHLKGTESGTRMHNFTADVRNCEVYAYLVEQIAPKEKRPFMHSTKAILDAVDLVQRAEMVLQNAEQLDCRVFVRPQDIVSGSQRLNLAFLANLFHGYPALEKPPDVEEKVAEIEETREEKTYRNWINSMGIVPAVNYLFSDLTDGLTLLKLFDLVKKRSVDWSRVNSDLCKATAKINFQCLENCNYAVNLGRQFGFSLVGLGGEDIQQGKRTMTLALLWQLMRAYTLSVLTRLTEAIPILHDRQQTAGRSPPISETEIIHWTNEKLRQCGKTSRISDAFGFADPALATGHTVIDLIDAIRPGSVDYSAVLPGMTRQERLTNAQYAIPLARRIGATVYAVPEDIVELKPKMIMTIFACLMTAALDDVCGVGTPKMNADNSGEVLEDLDLNGSKRSHLPAGDSWAGQVIDGPITGRPARNTFSTMWYPSLKEIERPDLNRVYVKTVCFTLSNTKSETQTGNSTLFTTGGGAGDCTENPISHCENKEEQSILHDMHSKRSDTHSPFDLACKRNVNIEKSRLTASISDCYKKMDKVPGPCPTPFSEKLSRPVPSIFVIDEETTEDADMLCSVDSSRTMRKFVPKISYDNTTSICTLDSDIPRHITEMAGGENVSHLNVVRETIESETSHVCRRREHNTNWSHGGGRLFIATKSKK
ncbi:unnamed protein product [Dicrocoelium dendriticum]|nr:unnamed protein product [Dicrocoelium dendriticum]